MTTPTRTPPPHPRCLVPWAGRVDTGVEILPRAPPTTPRVSTDVTRYTADPGPVVTVTRPARRRGRQGGRGVLQSGCERGVDWELDAGHRGLERGRCPGTTSTASRRRSAGLTLYSERPFPVWDDGPGGKDSRGITCLSETVEGPPLGFSGQERPDDVW